jgi:hypothetical protein
MNFPPVMMCDLFSACLMAACTIAITADGGFAITVDYSYFATIADYFITIDINYVQTAKSLFMFYTLCFMIMR